MNHQHNFEFGQVGTDFARGSWRERCTGCNHQSYSFFRSYSEVTGYLKRKLERRYD